VIPKWLWRTAPGVRRLLRPADPAIREIARFLVAPDPRIHALSLERDAADKRRAQLERRAGAAERRAKAAEDALAAGSAPAPALRAAAQEIRGLKAALRGLRADVKQAYEPVEVGSCRKVRYLHAEDARRHAAHVASRFPGDVFNIYRCRVCPRYVSPWNVPPWHVGHTVSDDTPGATWVDEDGLLHQPGLPAGPPVADPAPRRDLELRAWLRR
jgi:hypothetical protein